MALVSTHFHTFDYIRVVKLLEVFENHRLMRTEYENGLQTRLAKLLLCLFFVASVSACTSNYGSLSDDGDKVIQQNTSAVAPGEQASAASSESDTRFDQEKSDESASAWGVNSSASETGSNEASSRNAVTIKHCNGDFEVAPTNLILDCETRSLTVSELDWSQWGEDIAVSDASITFLNDRQKTVFRAKLRAFDLISDDGKMHYSKIEYEAIDTAPGDVAQSASFGR